MRRARRSRATGREQIIDELFNTQGLEAEPVSQSFDQHFPLRPFAAQVPHDERVNTESSTDETPAQRLYRRASEAAQRGRTTEAVLRYREVLELDPAHTGARNDLSLLLDAGGDHEAALETLSAALRASPDQPTLLVSRGAILGRLKRYPEAEADLRRAAKHHPEHAAAHLTLGLVLWRKGLPQDAAQSLRRTIQLEPDNPIAHHYLGEALNLAGDLEGALSALQHAAELDPAHGKTFHLMGRILDQLRRPEEAMAMYRRAREGRSQ